MKNLYYLSKLNLKGKNGKAILVILITLLVIAFTLIPCYTGVLENAVNLYKEDYTARSLYLSPSSGEYDEKITDQKALKNISKIKHVERVVDGDFYVAYNNFLVKNINDLKLEKTLNKKTTSVLFYNLLEGETKSVIAGETLDKSPVYSCLVPNKFYPFADCDDKNNRNLDYLDGTKFIGKTITLKSDENGTSLFFYTKDIADRTLVLNNFEITFKIVGTYDCVNSYFGNYGSLIVSKETNEKILDKYIKQKTKESKYKKSTLAEFDYYLKNNTIHPHYIVVDNYENRAEVYNKVSALGYSVDIEPDVNIDDNIVLMSNLMSTVGVTLTYVILAFAIFILFQATINGIRDRKGTIGLMKAIGYKNKQIFVSLALEQLRLTMIGFIIGGAISALLGFILNTIFSHGGYRDLMYVLNWGAFGIYLLIALGIVIIIPILCQLVLLGKLAKIQPQEAMINE